VFVIPLKKENARHWNAITSIINHKQLITLTFLLSLDGRGEKNDPCRSSELDSNFLETEPAKLLHRADSARRELNLT
jgi:hypothetical protein